MRKQENCEMRVECEASREKAGQGRLFISAQCTIFSKEILSDSIVYRFEHCCEQSGIGMASFMGWMVGEFFVVGLVDIEIFFSCFE